MQSSNKHFRAIAGTTAQSVGKAFERLFAVSSRYEGICVVRMPDACRQVSKKKFVRTRSPFDFVLAYEGQSAYVDCKTIAGNYFPFSDIVDHQLESLSNLGRHSAAGYVVWFRKSNSIRFFPWYDLHRLSKRESFSCADGLPLGTAFNFQAMPIFSSYHKNNGDIATANLLATGNSS